MKKEFIVNLNQIDNLKSFLYEMTYHIASNVDAKFEHQIVDAKSLLGLLSISSHPITVTIQSDDMSEIAYFTDVCERYEIKEG